MRSDAPNDATCVDHGSESSTSASAPMGRPASAVAASQKSFTDSLAKLCPIYDKVDPDMALGGSTYCRLQETAMRAILIERLSDAVNPH